RWTRSSSRIAASASAPFAAGPFGPTRWSGVRIVSYMRRQNEQHVCRQPNLARIERGRAVAAVLRIVARPDHPPVVFGGRGDQGIAAGSERQISAEVQQQESITFVMKAAQQQRFRSNHGAVERAGPLGTERRRFAPQ